MSGSPQVKTMIFRIRFSALSKSIKGRRGDGQQASHRRGARETPLQPRILSSMFSN
jgi:hypothetical protein